MGARDKWNQKNYDCVTIRFPKGTKRHFKALFPGVSFNGWVSNLVTMKLVLTEEPDDYIYDPADFFPYISKD